MNSHIVIFTRRATQFCFVCVLVFSVILCSPGLSKMMKYDLEQMAKESDVIALGRVSKIFKTNETDKIYGDRLIANVAIEQIIKGSPSIRNCKVYYYNNGESPRLSTSEKAIFFIKKYKGVNIFLQGFAGKLTVRDEVIEINYIRGEEPTQDLQKFITKLKSLVKVGR